MNSFIGKKVNVYDIFIGMYSRNTNRENEDVKLVEKKVCDYLEKNEIDFSISFNGGGYTYIDGSFISERGIHIYLINGDYNLSLKICRSLKMILEQESILLLKKTLEVMYI